MPEQAPNQGSESMVTLHITPTDLADLESAVEILLVKGNLQPSYAVRLAKLNLFLSSIQVSKDTPYVHNTTK